MTDVPKSRREGPGVLAARLLRVSMVAALQVSNHYARSQRVQRQK